MVVTFDLFLISQAVGLYRSASSASLAGDPKDLIEIPDRERSVDPNHDALSAVLRSIRLSRSMQFCFMSSGDWQTDASPALAGLTRQVDGAVPFHVVVEGNCWLNLSGQVTILEAGDVVAFPFGTGHQIGAGEGGRRITPMNDLPPRPWRQVPVLRYGDDPPRVRLLCGYLQCDAMNFPPLRSALPTLLHARTREIPDAHWLRATVAQIRDEVELPRVGGLSMLERLAEITFIELLRHQVALAGADTVGWLAALTDRALGRCLSLIHEEPGRKWSLREIAAASGLSRSALADRFEAILGTSLVRYLRDWRLHLASLELSMTTRPIAAIAHDAGYAAEAAFSRAFSKAYGTPPAEWRRNLRHAP